MSLIESKTSKIEELIKQDAEKKQEIENHVLQEPSQITENEKQMMYNITSKISNMYKERIAREGSDNAVLNREIIQTIKNEADKLDVSFETQKRIEKATISNIIGLGPIEQYRLDDDVTEIIVERFDKICIEKHGNIYNVDASFTDEQHLQNIINRIVQPIGRQINLSNPIVDARLSDGSRVNATIPPISPDGATLTIRKFSKEMITKDGYLENHSLNEKMLYFLAKCMQGKISGMISGGTSSGKTTFLNLLSSFIPKDELIITIEDSCELQLKQPHVRRLETRDNGVDGTLNVTQSMLVKNCLRMRPDRIIVGESRDGSVVDMIGAMNTGHDGSWSTVHANSPRNLIDSRFLTLFSMNKDTNFSEESIKLQISQALYLIVQVSRMKNGSRKVTHITEVSGINEDMKIELNDIFLYDDKKDEFYATGYVPNRVLKALERNNVNVNVNIFESEV